MLVENDENDIFFVQRALHHAGYVQPLIVANSGKKAVEYLQKAEVSDSIPNPHIILMDIKMPGMDGFDVLRWIRENSLFRNLPVIMLSSSDAPSDMTKSRRLGIFKFVTKRIHYNDMLTALESFLSSQEVLQMD
jgi:CheY-like chemotaxis protein